MLRRCRIQVREDLRFVNVARPVHVPAITKATPAIHVEATKNRTPIRGGGLVVPVNLSVDLLHPARFVMLRRIFPRRSASFPIIEPVALGHVQREIIQRRRNPKIDPVFVHIKARVKADAAELVRAVNIVVVISARTDV
jgi:hypothetical protein